MDFGILLKVARVKARLTQSELAKRLGVQAQHISQWECGKRSPTLKTVLRLCKALNVSVVSFLSDLEEGDAYG